MRRAHKFLITNCIHTHTKIYTYTFICRYSMFLFMIVYVSTQIKTQIQRRANFIYFFFFVYLKSSYVPIRKICAQIYVYVYLMSRSFSHVLRTPFYNIVFIFSFLFGSADFLLAVQRNSLSLTLFKMSKEKNLIVTH